MKRDQDTAVNSVCFKQNRRWKGRAATFTYKRRCLALGKEEFGPAYHVAALCVRVLLLFFHHCKALQEQAVMNEGEPYPNGFI
ncbi:hypothetical protein NDU88_004759 [Pleurodeles waltl]|uniref:Uncharacterized protein n=1 Tax=Pleurodeles waltl TaxID=8319 RepID=A0AAV7L7M1_PLEWA|nr:hypothetical protein NDU88_004759 [Pleurodeles waltl]